jgi:hypothetical protein
MCNKCLYKKNCQFLAKHRKTIVEGCTAFESENKVRAEAIKEFVERLKEYKYLSREWSHGEHPYVVEVDDIDNLAEEMTGIADD